MTLTKELQAALYAAFAEAQRRRHEYLTLEHVLYAMTIDTDARKILRALGIDIAELQADLEQFFAESVDALPPGKEPEPRQTPTFQRVLQRATVQMQAAGKEEVDTGSLLAAFFREPASHATYLL